MIIRLGIFFLAFLPLWAYPAADELQRALALINEGRSPQAIERLQSYLQSDPGNHAARLLLANAYAAAQDDDNAIKTYKALLERRPASPAAYNNLAALLAKRGQFHEARELLMQAIELDPHYVTVTKNLNEIYSQLASIAYNKALERKEAAAPLSNLALIVDLEEPPVVPASQPVAAPNAESAPPADGGTTPIVDTPDALTERVRDWARAWSQKDADAYLAFYAEDFVLPDGTTRLDWEKMRRERVAAPSYINVDIKNPRVYFWAQGALASVHFSQQYRSDNIKDTVPKMLLLAKRGEVWKIVQEQALR